MKKVLLVALSLLMITPAMQAKDKEEEVKIVIVKEDNSDNYYYEGIVPVEGVTKEEMFKRAKQWVLSNFKTGDNNAQFDEQDLSIFNSPTIVLKSEQAFLNFKISILFKEGKYKFRFDNLVITAQINGRNYTNPYGPKRFGKGFFKNVMIESNQVLSALTLDLDNVIKGIKTKKDDW